LFVARLSALPLSMPIRYNGRGRGLTTYYFVTFVLPDLMRRKPSAILLDDNSIDTSLFECPKPLELLRADWLRYITLTGTFIRDDAVCPEILALPLDVQEKIIFVRETDYKRVLSDPGYQHLYNAHRRYYKNAPPHRRDSNWLVT
jgi:hypothetical protein